MTANWEQKKRDACIEGYCGRKISVEKLKKHGSL